MTGGSLPAMTWHEIMSYAHTGIELKALPGQPAYPPGPAAVAQGAAAAPGAAPTTQPSALSKATIQVISGIGDVIRSTRGKRASISAPPGFAGLGAAGYAPVYSINGRIQIE